MLQSEPSADYDRDTKDGHITMYPLKIENNDSEQNDDVYPIEMNFVPINDAWKSANTIDL